jgi:bifunctional DNase/RNase
MKRVLDAKLKPASAEIELEPFGVTGGMDKARPVMLFREKGGEAVLPVWLSPVDAGIALSLHNTSAVASSPHEVTLHVLSELGVKPETCHFTELKGHMQYAEVKFTGSKKLKTVKSRADHAVSFCLAAQVKFYCTREFLEKAREVDAEMGQLIMKSKGEHRRNRQYYLN